MDAPNALNCGGVEVGFSECYLSVEERVAITEIDLHALAALQEAFEVTNRAAMRACLDEAFDPVRAGLYDPLSPVKAINLMYPDEAGIAWPIVHGVVSKESRQRLPIFRINRLKHRLDVPERTFLRHQGQGSRQAAWTLVGGQAVETQLVTGHTQS
jgi:hypothetical protein